MARPAQALAKMDAFMDHVRRSSGTKPGSLKTELNTDRQPHTHRKTTVELGSRRHCRTTIQSDQEIRYGEVGRSQAWLFTCPTGITRRYRLNFS